MIILGYSSLRLCDFVKCLKEKVISILGTFQDKLGNQMAAENLWTKTNEAKHGSQRNDESSSEAVLWNLQRVTTDGTWGTGIFDEMSPKWGLVIPLSIIAWWHKEVRENKQLVISELLLVFLPIVMVRPSEIG